MKVLSLQSRQFSTGGGGGGGASFSIVSSDPGSPTAGQAWLLKTDFVDTTLLTDNDAGGLWGGAILFAITPYATGNAVSLIGNEFKIDSSVKFFIGPDDGVSVGQASIAANGSAGLVVTYAPTTTLNQLISALNVFSQAAISKNTATLGGGYNGADLVSDYTFGGSLEFAFNSNQTIATGTLKVQGTGLVYTFPSTLSL